MIYNSIGPLYLMGINVLDLRGHSTFTVISVEQVNLDKISLAVDYIT